IPLRCLPLVPCVQLSPQRRGTSPGRADPAAVPSAWDPGSRGPSSRPASAKRVPARARPPPTPAVRGSGSARPLPDPRRPHTPGGRRGNAASRSASGRQGAPAPVPALAAAPPPLLRRTRFPASTRGSGGGGGGRRTRSGAGTGPGRGRRRGQPGTWAGPEPGRAAGWRRTWGRGRGAGAGPGARMERRAAGAQPRRRKQPPRPADFKLQVIIIGSRGVGKTSLMERFTDDTFCEACKSTVGVDFKIKTVELRGKKIRLQIWDTAGQERFNSITSAYYRSAKGIILVYDITKKETFDDLPKWMKMIDKYASEDAELLLVGNKLDCEMDREVSRQQGEKFAQQITGMRFCEASAKDNFNVDEIFLKLVDDILKKMPLDVLRNELSNSILSLQPEPEVPPELPPPRPHVRCC
ncbi:ras-related protein Rab-12, partial [Cavia porcellus]